MSRLINEILTFLSSPCFTASQLYHIVITAAQLV